MLEKVKNFFGAPSNVRTTNKTCVVGKLGGIGLTKHQYDELKKESVENFDSIELACSSCPVKITVSDFKDVEAHFYGEAYLKGDVKFNVMQCGNTLKIKVELNGTFQNANFQLDVSIPSGKKFKKLKVTNSMENIQLFGDLSLVKNVALSNSLGKTFVSGKMNDIEIESSSGDISIEGNVKNIKVKSSLGKITLNTMSVEKLQLKNSEGNSIIRGDFKVIDVESDMGSVDSKICAKSDIQINIETSLGNACFKFENIKKVNAVGTTSLGKITNKGLRNPNGYIANIKYKTSLGNIKIE